MDSRVSSGQVYRLNPAQSMLFAVVPIVFLAGCASPGTPRPPSLHLPALAAGPTAERAGEDVLVRWTTSAKTTDDLNMTGTLTAQLCRSILLPGASPTAAVCSPVRRATVKPGLSEVMDRLPAALVADPETLLAYRIEIFNDRGHSAGLSSPVFAAGGAAPPAVKGLRLQASPQGAVLEWEAQDAGDTIELDRLHIMSSSPRPVKQSLQPTTKEPDELRLRASRVSSGDLPFRPDAGGTLDRTARRDETYAYTAQRVRSVVLDGHPLEIRSALSPAITIRMSDSFPPRPPAGLETISIGQGGSPAVDLSWRPNTEIDLAGYFIYRQEIASDGTLVGVRQRLNTTPGPEPGFHDVTVVAGHTYTYSITAVDGSGNESAPGPPAREEIRLP